MAKMGVLKQGGEALFGSTVKTRTATKPNTAHPVWEEHFELRTLDIPACSRSVS